MSEENILTLERISKYFESNKAVDELSLEIKQGEIFTLLGPSGCGKTTTLRQVAGLEQPDEGKISFRNTILASPSDKIFVPPYKRNMGMVFQSYAIWPHLTIFETVAYPLRARRIPGTERRKRVMDILELVGLGGLENRPGPALSGGQQQRVALARALVYEPEILLLDEPFSNLDVKLREQMRVELKLLQRRVGVTVLLVTHDQLEALSLSDRIAIMNKGRVEQVGIPKTLYEHPRSSFVRDFVGASVIMPGKIVETSNNEETKILLSGKSNKTLVSRNHSMSKAIMAQEIVIAIRPEDISILSDLEQSKGNELEGTINALLFVGDRYECHIQLGDTSVLVYAPRNQRLAEGQSVRLYFPPEAVTVWPK
ncbi:MULTISPECIES: ABC transporter ATP-binding protein [unclassified Paenibacillus]|uniref:ABC transporter ATP-binding protein n=1 Tax=unclassified Paenibacillus TaxID=185978 RepID=UPI001AE601F0|nr:MULTISPECIES: ABC transporter ATP-binding protein [unclassified Paenibacillus]MBP1155401.1 ABC-type Fe3+/spermidine/putrescine transport system ATPase subunit [Paenibacillus sp. PvP091]MBP1169214.1 ABC-type Fe3+/spermidine/putrescine transport system ATPase subunit [Paenibacillus sp. PvR098]MBP2440242.1 ABC-type Fe3+/spermidine/putrescine transport system ATPase subunit [Paenibacillus sp. PvP052]